MGSAHASIRHAAIFITPVAVGLPSVTPVVHDLSQSFASGGCALPGCERSVQSIPSISQSAAVFPPSGNSNPEFTLHNVPFAFTTQRERVRGF